jgi:hypothetical protein
MCATVVLLKALPSGDLMRAKTESSYDGLSVGKRDRRETALVLGAILLMLIAWCVRSTTRTGVIRRRGPWRNLEAVEFATLTWVDWFNTRRLLEPIGYVPGRLMTQRAQPFGPAVGSMKHGEGWPRPPARHTRMAVASPGPPPQEGKLSLWIR